MKIKKFCMLINEMGIVKSIQWIYFRKFKKSLYESILLERLKEENLDIIEKYKKYNNNADSCMITASDNIWFFWWQGKNNMPILVKNVMRA